MLLPLLLFAGAFLSNIAIAVVPHEPIVIWFGGALGWWITALVATLGTVAACWVDHRLIFPGLRQLLRREASAAALQRPLRWFNRAPFLTVALSGLTPLPFWPFKVLAFAAGYPLARYLLAVALGRLPRYLLLAWIGRTFSFPSWAISLLCLALLGLGFSRSRSRRSVAPPRRRRM